LSGEGTEKLRRQLALANDLLLYTRQRLQARDDGIDPLSEPLQLLHAVHRHGKPPARAHPHSCPSCAMSLQPAIRSISWSALLPIPVYESCWMFFSPFPLWGRMECHLPVCES
jgi:hypothetical protein